MNPKHSLLFITLLFISGCLSKIDLNVKKAANVSTPPPSLLTSIYVAQAQGSLSVTNRLTITGEGLLNLKNVSVAGISCLIFSQSATEAICDINASIAPDWYDIVLTDTNDTEKIISDGYASGALVIGAPTFQVSSDEPIGMYPTSVRVFDNHLFVTDTSSSERILQFNSVPTSTVAPDKVVFGQMDFKLSYSHKRSLGTQSIKPFDLSSVQSTCKNSSQFFIVEFSNNRILVFNSIPTSWDQTPDFVLGQRTLESVAKNVEGVTASSLNNPRSIHCDDTHIIVPDEGNNRVLVWNGPIHENYQAADVVIGQGDFISNAANRGGTAQINTISSPRGIHYKSNYLFISDSGNNRVLIYHGIPNINGENANQVLGQTLFTVSTTGITSARFNNPADLSLGANYLWLADRSNHRVLGWSLATAINTWANGKAADIVLGQDNFTTKLINKGGAPSLATMRDPISVLEHGTQLFVADYTNRRVLGWNTIPATNSVAASFQLGQNSSSDANLFPSLVHAQGIPRTRGGVVSGSGKIYSMEYETGRITRFPIPTQNNPTADLALGQPNLNSSMLRPPLGSNTDTNMQTPRAIFWDSIDGSLLVSSSGQNRVMIWSTEPTTSGQTPSIILGQPNGTTVTAGTTSSKMDDPIGICRSGSHLYVAECGNNRIVRFTYPLSSSQSADLVLGQPDFTSNLVNQGTTLAANSLSCPYGLYCDNDRLIAVDYGNDRVLIWNGLPTTNNEPADVVLGQPDFSTKNVNVTPNRTSLAGPRFVAYRNDRLVVTDASNNRILIWNTLPTQNHTPPDQMMGQESYTTNLKTKYGTVELVLGGFSEPLLVDFLDDDRIITADVVSGYIQILPLPSVGNRLPEE